MLADGCIKYYSSLSDDGLPYDLKGAIELNRSTEVETKDSRLLIVSLEGACWFAVGDFFLLSHLFAT